ncbi:MAG: flavodoxin family protein [Clostridia bacterium]|nr:flavodoxin family protein [Clostridia bacterium]
MKVLMFNGSPHKEGCTYTALCEIGAALAEKGIDHEIFWSGLDPVAGCRGCGGCRKNGGKCVISSDRVNEFVEKMAECDALIVGSPVHYASASGTATAFLDRAFYSGSAGFAFKPGAAIVSCRRGGASAAFDQLNKYFTIARMPLVSSQYWNQIHGNNAEEAKQDLEGLQTMRTLGYNMAWMLRCIEAGRAAGVEFPEREPVIRTNFIR